MLFSRHGNWRDRNKHKYFRQNRQHCFVSNVYISAAMFCLRQTPQYFSGKFPGFFTFQHRNGAIIETNFRSLQNKFSNFLNWGVIINFILIHLNGTAKILNPVEISSCDKFCSVLNVKFYFFALRTRASAPQRFTKIDSYY